MDYVLVKLWRSRSSRRMSMGSARMITAKKYLEMPRKSCEGAADRSRFLIDQIGIYRYVDIVIRYISEC